jgi:signal transduction histidine kinase
MRAKKYFNDIHGEKNPQIVYSDIGFRMEDPITQELIGVVILHETASQVFGALHQLTLTNQHHLKLAQQLVTLFVLDARRVKGLGGPTARLLKVFSELTDLPGHIDINRVAESLTQESDAQLCAIFLTTEPGAVSNLPKEPVATLSAASANLQRFVDQITVGASDGRIGRAFSSGVSERLQTDEDCKSIGKCGQAFTQCLAPHTLSNVLIVPFSVDKVVTGVIVLVNQKPEQVIDDNLQDTLTVWLSVLGAFMWVVKSIEKSIEAHEEARSAHSFALKASDVVHRVNAPLHLMINASNNLQYLNLKPEQRTECFQDLNQGIETIANAVRTQFRVIDRPEPVEAVKLGELVERTLKSRRRGDQNMGFQLISKFDPNLTLSGNYDDFVLVLNQLIDNSLKHGTMPNSDVQKDTPVTLEIIIEGSQDIEDGVHLGKVCIRDNGPGFDKERIASPFSVTATAGTSTLAQHGRGLKLCKQLLKQYGADIHLKNGSNQGAVVILHCQLWKKKYHVT